MTHQRRRVDNSLTEAKFEKGELELPRRGRDSAAYDKIARIGSPSAILIGRPMSETCEVSGATPQAELKVAKISATSTLPSSTDMPSALVRP